MELYLSNKNKPLLMILGGAEGRLAASLIDDPMRSTLSLLLWNSIGVLMPSGTQSGAAAAESHFP